MAKISLVQNWVFRWQHLHWFQTWPPGCITFIATLPWIVLLALSVTKYFPSSSARPDQTSPLRVNASSDALVRSEKLNMEEDSLDLCPRRQRELLWRHKGDWKRPESNSNGPTTQPSQKILLKIQTFNETFQMFRKEWAAAEMSENSSENFLKETQKTKTKTKTNMTICQL